MVPRVRLVVGAQEVLRSLLRSLSKLDERFGFSIVRPSTDIDESHKVIVESVPHRRIRKSLR
jgi:hypothetical protein